VREGLATFVGGSVWILLVGAAVVAAMGGMFASTTPTRAAASTMTRSVAPAPTRPLPTDSGHGRRVVFDQSEQRVWLVAADGSVARTYRVTGSNRGNVSPGFYRVKSRTRYARTFRGGGTLEYFVRFTMGRRAPIGFHSVTMLNNGRLVYTRADLGTPHTPGCVEAWRNDARALWNFAPVGTPVVVTV
jgi:lipoprotein-anchoring transpeptidase ErfK/SrfK